MHYIRCISIGRSAMTQHFLLSSKAKTLSLATVMRLSDDEAFKLFCAIRWEGGEPICPKCGCDACYTYTARRIFKCKGCGSQFSATSGTIFNSRKLKLRDYLGAIAIFVNGAKGVSALQVSRDLCVSYQCAFVLCHKLREAMMIENHVATMGGDVEIDAAYFGGHMKPENRLEDRKDRRLKENQTGKRRAVVVMREREGRTVADVFASESAAVPAIAARVESGATIYADEGTAWDALHARFAMKRVNHSVMFKDEDACTNQAESYFSRLRRAEIGTHHRIAHHLNAYAGEMAWREDNRRKSNGEQFRKVVCAAATAPKSERWTGYWQR